MPPTTSNTQTTSSLSPIMKVLGILLLVCGIFAATAFWYYKKTDTTSTPTNRAANETYLELKTDQNFVDASIAYKNFEFQKAYDLYLQTAVSDPAQYSFIQYQLAETLFNIDRNKGIAAFSNLVASSSINTQTKGYSINALGRYFSSTHDVNILIETKKLAANSWKAEEVNAATTLNSFLEATTTKDMLISLLEVGGSYYSVMDSEMRLAYLYALKANEARIAKNTAEVDTHISKSLQKLSVAELDPNKTALSENLSWMIPLSLNRKAMTLDLLRKNGQEAENPATYFEQALNISATQGIRVQPFILYHYASYIAVNGGGDQNVISLLEQIVKHRNLPELIPFFEFTKNAFRNNEVANVEELNLLAKIYPKFGEIIR